jgi:hypothetical protein
MLGFSLLANQALQGTRCKRRAPELHPWQDWLFGGKKHGWSLRYKKGKSFCTLIPEKNRFAIQIVFGAEEREKVEAIRDELSARTQADYDRAKTYHDGKWLLLTVDADDVVADVERLLAVKRNPKNTK